MKVLYEYSVFCYDACIQSGAIAEDACSSHSTSERLGKKWQYSLKLALCFLIAFLPFSYLQSPMRVHVVDADPAARLISLRS